MNNRKEIPTRSLKNIDNYKRYMLLIIFFPLILSFPLFEHVP